ncbi:MAG: hypothetical protein RI909_2133, partial [Bacteroidota bacterium]
MICIDLRIDADVNLDHGESDFKLFQEQR